MTSDEQPHVSIVIPVLNERENIAGCILNAQQPGHDLEIIVADGGSSDGTVEIAQGFGNVRIVHAPPGRGIQIARGVQVARGRVVLILHADSRLLTGSLDKMNRALEHRPEAAGGAFAVDYADPRAGFRFVSALNNLRARLTGISFGDQAQFFRRDALKSGFPELRLMEDVELSLRLKRAGPVLFVRNGVLGSTRRWKGRGYFTNAAKVVWLTLTYLMRRARIRDGGESFYRQYYGRESGRALVNDVNARDRR